MVKFVLFFLLIFVSLFSIVSSNYPDLISGINVSDFIPKKEVEAKQIIVLNDSYSSTTKEVIYGENPLFSNSNFFEDTKLSFIKSNSDFIDANLTTMKLSVYKKGEKVKEVSIVSKGKEGLWWETPAGIYLIQNKEKSHYSTMGQVYQPWSMQFQGNFFIHGWPEYKNGEKTSRTFTGGCIKLEDDDAKAVYDLVSVGVPVIVYEASFKSDNFIYPLSFPNISSDSFMVVDLQNNMILTQKNATATMSIASVTKLMTGLVASEYINLDKNVKIKKEYIVKTSLPRLKVGSKYSVYSLLFPLLTESSNEAAEAISSVIGRNYFISNMNKKSKSLGMKNTIFTDPSGADSGNVSTVEDLFMLSKYLYNNRKFLLLITSDNVDKSAYSLSFSGLSNFNLYKDDPNFVGGKIGKTTAAKESYVGIFEYYINGEKRPIAFIVLRSDDVLKDMNSLRSFISQKFAISQ